MPNTKLDTLQKTSLLLFIFLFSLSPIVYSQSSLLFEIDSEKAISSTPQKASDISIYPIRINMEVLKSIEKKEVQKVSLPITDNHHYLLNVQEVIYYKNEGWSVIGSVNGEKLNSFILSYLPSRGTILATINILSEHSYFELRFDTESNSHILAEKDPHKSDELPCGHDSQLTMPTTSQTNQAIQNIVPSEESETSIIDVMIIYTPQAEAWANSNNGGIGNVVNQAMATAQLAANNSELDIDFQLVHSQLINYTETGNSNTDLFRLTASQDFNPFGSQYDGYMEEVHEIRDLYGADLVALFTYTQDVGGLGWINTSPVNASNYGFSITRVQQAAGSTHAHEMGHNFGNAHSRNQVENSALGQPGIFPYSTGWRWTGNNGVEYVSIMTYTEGANRALLFSNPDILYQGVPSGSYEGEYAPADNARSMSEVQHFVEDFRTSNSNIDLPIVITSSVSDISVSTAAAGGNVTDDGGAMITARGVCWGQDSNPGFTDSCINEGTGLGAFSTILTELSPSTNYYIRAYATNSAGLAFGSQKSFTTQALPAPTALNPSNTNAVSFTARWTHVDNADRYYIDASTNPSFSTFIPGYQNREVANQTNIDITDLSPGTEYYYRVRSGVETAQSYNSNTVQALTTDISSTNSEVTASRDKVLATGIQESVITVHVSSSSGKPVEGVQVFLEQNEGQSTISPANQITDSEGNAEFIVTAIMEQSIQYTVFADGLKLSDVIEVDFVFSDGQLTLGNNYPNPYNNQTIIPIVVPQQSRVRLVVYNSAGAFIQTIVDQEYNVGYYEIPFIASGLASGVYFYRMITDLGVRVEKMLLMK